MKLIKSENVETNKYELEIHVEADAFNAAIDHAYAQKGKNINVPGFRKGKAPRKMIEKLYGEGVFFDDAIEEVYPAALDAAIEEAKLEVVGVEKLEPTEVGADKGFTFKATCVVKPEVTLADYKGIKVEKNLKAVADADVAEELDRMRDRNARIVSVEGRAAKNGDTVVFDFDGYVDGEAFDGGKAEGYTLELGSGQFIPGFEEQIAGHNVEEDFDVNVTFPEEYHVAELKGKPAIFKCKVHEIKEKELPELDDEFAKDVSEFDTLDELKADIRKKMEENNERNANNEMEDALLKAVVENMEAEIPQVMYDQRVQDLVRDFSNRLQSQGMNLDLYMQYTGMDMEAIKGQFTEQAQMQVKVRLALEKIAELEHIEIAEEEVEAELEKMAKQYDMELDKFKALAPVEEIKKDMRVSKALELLKDNAKVSAPKASKTTKAAKADAAEPAEKAEKAADKPKKTTRAKKTAEKAEKAE